MNIKQFLLFKACDVLPSELKYYIYDIVKYDAVCSIQNIYMLKVKKNVDIFMKLMYFYERLSQVSIWRRRLPTRPKRYSKYVHDFILYYAAKNITYKYIQEPATWIYYLDNIINIYFWDKTNNEINVVYHMMNKIRDSSEIYNNTRVIWWDNF